MQASVKRKDYELVNVRSRWTEQERAERRLMAERKQRWMSEILGFEIPCRKKKQPSLSLAKAG